MSSDASPMRKRTKEPLFFRRINNGTSFGETVISEYQLELVDKQSGYKFTTNNKSKIMESTDDYKFQNILNQINDVDQEKQQKQHNINDFESTVFKTLQANRQKMVFKPVTLNMLVAGGQRLGKSTFIDAFLNRDFDIQDIIRPSTDQIKDYHAVRKEGSVKLQLKLIDSPGHGDKLNIQQWYKMLKGYIKSQYKQYKINKNEYLQNMNSQINDTLVHVCLYFISGSQLTENEMVYLKKLCKYVNIIPLLAKGDTYQEEEILVIKKQILQQKVQNNLNWFDCVEALKEYPQKIKLITESKFGPSPPFLVITSCQKTLFSDNQYYYARKYSWGICNIENPDHCEFSLFCNIILGYLSDQLIISTQQFYKDFVQRKKTKKLKQKNIQKINQLNQIVDKKTQFALALPFLGIFLYGLSKFNK